jgi:hypothetical protein
LASLIKDFACVLELKNIKFDVSWKKALYMFSNVLNKELNKDLAKNFMLQLLQNI